MESRKAARSKAVASTPREGSKAIHTVRAIYDTEKTADSQLCAHKPVMQKDTQSSLFFSVEIFIRIQKGFFDTSLLITK